MPELPEVEHAARTLRRWISKSARIDAIRVPPSRVVSPADRRALQAQLPGRRLRSIARLGKWLLLAFDGDVGIVSHLGMTGKWQRVRAGAPEPRHVRFALELSSGDTVYYTDPRMFGHIELRPAHELPAVVAHLGPDPLLHGVDAAALHARLARTSRPIKVALLDQTVIAGVGNIQATEALWRAKLDPGRPARALTRAEVGRLARGVRDSIAYTLKAQGRGDSITYVEEGGANPFRVYGRHGEPCPRCGAALERRTQAGRTTTYCPVCQGPGTRRGARQGRPSRWNR